MPKIPTEPQLYQTDVPGSQVNPSQAGVAQSAIAQAGATLASTSLSLLKDLKESEARNAANKAFSEYSVATSEYWNKLKADTHDGYAFDPNANQGKGDYITDQDGFPKTISQEFRDRANDILEKTHQDLPNQMAQDLYSTKVMDHFNTQITSYQNQENVIRADYTKKNIEASGMDYANAQLSNPDPHTAYAAMQDVIGNVNDSVRLHNLSASEGIETSKVQLSTIANARYEGAIKQILFAKKELPVVTKLANVQALEDEVNGIDKESKRLAKNGLPTVAGVLLPSQKLKILNDIASLKNSIKDNNNKEYEIGKRNIIGTLSSGGSVSNETMDWFKSMAATKAKNPGEAASVAEDMGMVRAAQISAQTGTDPLYNIKSRAEREKISDANANNVYNTVQSHLHGPGSDVIGGDLKGDIRAADDKKNTVIDAKLQKDYALEMDKYSPRSVLAATQISDLASLEGKESLLKDAIDEKLGQYDKTFPGQPQYKRILSDPTSKMWAKQLTEVTTSPAGSELKVRYINNLFKSTHGPAIIDQMLKDNKEMPRAFELFKTTHSPTVMIDMMNIINTKKSAIMSEFASVIGKRSSEKLVSDAVHDAMKPVAQAIRSTYSDEPAYKNALSEITNTVVSKTMTSMTASGNASATQVAKDIVGNWFSDHNYYIQPGATLFGVRGSPTMIQIPKVINGVPVSSEELSNMQNFTIDNTTAEGLKSKGAIPPPRSDGSPTHFSAEFYPQAASNGYWAPDPKFSGFYFMHKMGNTFVPIYGPGNKPLLVPFDEVKSYKAPINRVTPLPIEPFEGSY